MVELPIPVNAPRFWVNYFFSCSTWQEAEMVLRKQWHGRAVYNPRMPGMIDKIVFENDADATAFLLRWS